MAIECAEILQTRDYLLQQFQSCKKLKSSDMQLLVDLTYSVGQCATGEGVGGSSFTEIDLGTNTNDFTIGQLINQTPSFTIPNDKFAVFRVLDNSGVEFKYLSSRGSGTYGVPNPVYVDSDLILIYEDNTAREYILNDKFFDGTTFPSKVFDEQLVADNLNTSSAFTLADNEIAAFRFRDVGTGIIHLFSITTGPDTYGVGGTQLLSTNIILLASSDPGLEERDQNIRTGFSRTINIPSSSSLIFANLGNLTFTGNLPSTTVVPTLAGHLANKQYIDNAISGVVNSGTSLAGANQIIPNDVAREINLNNANSFLQIKDRFGGTLFNIGEANFTLAEPPIITGSLVPTVPNRLTTKDYVDNQVATKQDTLVSATNIKTINTQSILGSGDITIAGAISAENQARIDNLNVYREIVHTTNHTATAINAYNVDSPYEGGVRNILNVNDIEYIVNNVEPLNTPFLIEGGEALTGTAIITRSSDTIKFLVNGKVDSKIADDVDGVTIESLKTVIIERRGDNLYKITGDVAVYSLVNPELNTQSNATSPSNEANGITPWDNDGGNSQDSTIESLANTDSQGGAFMLRATSQNNGVTYINWNLTGLTIGENYTVTYRARVDSVNEQRTSGFWQGVVSDANQIPTTSWQTFTQTVEASATTIGFRLYISRNASGLVGDNLYISEFSVVPA